MSMNMRISEICSRKLTWSTDLMKRFVTVAYLATVFILSAQGVQAQALYSYIDENNIQVFTNIPPVGKVLQLKVTGEPEAPPTVVKPAVKSRNFDPIIEKYALEHNLDPSLIRSIIAQESGFNPNAVSLKGAQGLMQLMPSTAARLGVVDSFDPEQNIKGGVKHFRWLMNNFNNDLNLSLAAYNAGENLVQRLGRIPEIKETRDYVKSITKRYSKSEASAQNTNQPAPEPVYPTVRFVDESGTLHLTNIPPLR